MIVYLAGLAPVMCHGFASHASYYYSSVIKLKFLPIPISEFLIWIMTQWFTAREINPSTDDFIKMACLFSVALKCTTHHAKVRMQKVYFALKEMFTTTHPYTVWCRWGHSWLFKTR